MKLPNISFGILTQLLVNNMFARTLSTFGWVTARNGLLGGLYTHFPNEFLKEQMELVKFPF